MPGIPSVQRVPIGAAPQSMEAAVSPYLSNIRTAQVAANAVGGAISAYYEKSKKIKDSGDYAKAKLELEKADADIEQWEAENPKEFDKYENNAKERINKARAAITQDMSGEVRQQVEQEFAVREQRTVTGAKYRATQGRNKDTEQTFIAAGNLAYLNGDTDMGDAYVDLRVKFDMLPAEGGEIMKKQGRVMAEQKTAQQMILDNPQEALASLQSGKFKNLDPDQQLALQGQAERQIGKIHADTSQKYQQMLLNEELINPADIDKDVEAGNMLPSVARYFKRQITGKADPGEALYLAGVYQKEMLALAEDDPQRVFKEREIASKIAVLPPDLAGRLTTVYLGMFKNDGTTANPKFGLERIASLWESNALGYKELTLASEAGQYKDDTGKMVDKKRGEPLRSKDFNLSLARRSYLESEFLRFLKEYPKATIDDQMTKIDSLLKDDITAVGAENINGPSL
jgi:hypothetical protein